MAILPALQSAAIRLIGQKPGTFFGASGTFEMEICDLVNEVAQDIAKYQDWQALVRTATITGTGVATGFDLPTDYDRMLGSAVVQDATNWAWGYQRIHDYSSFMELTARGFSPFPGGWIISGGQMKFAPAPALNNSAQYPYVTANWAVGSDDVGKPAFTADTDRFLLAERLLTLGLVWRWRENKSLACTGDQEAFIKALDEIAAKDSGTRIIRSNSRRGWPGVSMAYPYQLG